MYNNQRKYILFLSGTRYIKKHVALARMSTLTLWYINDMVQHTGVNKVQVISMFCSDRYETIVIKVFINLEVSLFCFWNYETMCIKVYKVKPV